MYKGLNAIVLENDALCVTFLPDYACKTAGLVSKKTGREFLFQSTRETLEIPPYAAPFSRYDSSGFDEVFPSIDACPYPYGKYAGTPVPDHGEVWALPWDCTPDTAHNALSACVKSPRLPYILSKHVSLRGNEIRFAYRVQNTSDEPFYFIWTPHCLLACSPATRLLVPDNLREVISVEHGTQHLGPWGTRHTYPLTTDVNGKPFDLAATEPATAKNCEKFYFTSRNTAGWCGIRHTDSGEELLYRYDADKVPFLGVWKTHGGYRGDYNIALEPCTGIYDDLYLAYKIRRAAAVAPQGEYAWNFTILIR